MNATKRIGIAAGWGPTDYSRKRAAETIQKYDRCVGDLNFGNETQRRLFANYLAEHARGNDTMRGYFAAFNRH
jgi:hypothetical protein